MEVEKDYILYFHDGKVRRVFGKRSQFLNLPISRIEEAAPSYDPFSNARRDMERINRALGQGFKLLQNVMSPQQLLNKLGMGQNGYWPRKR